MKNTYWIDYIKKALTNMRIIDENTEVRRESEGRKLYDVQYIPFLRVDRFFPGERIFPSRHRAIERYRKSKFGELRADHEYFYKTTHSGANLNISLGRIIIEDKRISRGHRVAVNDFGFEYISESGTKNEYASFNAHAGKDIVIPISVDFREQRTDASGMENFIDALDLRQTRDSLFWEINLLPPKSFIDKVVEIIREIDSR